MFRKTRGLWAAVVCGFLASVVFFIIGIAETVRFSRWDPYKVTDWQSLLSSMHLNFWGTWVLHSFLFDVCIAALFFFLALGSQIYDMHPASTVAGLGFLSVPLTLMAIRNVWLAVGQNAMLLRYQSTADTALRQTFQTFYQANLFGVPILSALIAYFGFWGFLFLGYAFRGRRETRMGLWGWCWLSALSLLWAIVSLSFGYYRTFRQNAFPRTLMIWGDLGVWVLPSITLALCAAWLYQRGKALAISSHGEMEPREVRAA